MDNWSKNFHDLLNSDFGKEVVRTLTEDLHNSIIEDARKAKNAEQAYGLIKEASGVIKAIEHLQFRAVTPKGDGSSN